MAHPDDDPAPRPGADGTASPVEAVDRALRVLEALAAAGPHGAGLADLAAGLDLNKTTVHRTLAALRHRGFASQEPSGRYALGPAATRLAEDYFSDENLPVLLHPALVALSREVDELVHLGVLSGREVVYLDKVEPQRAVRVWSAVGRRRPAATTALGRALLAAGPLREPAGGEVGADALAPYVTGGVGPDRLLAALVEARTTGVATETEENEPGIACAAVAVLRAGHPVAAVSITAPVERMTGAARAERIDALRTTLPRLLPPGLSLTPPPA